MRRFIRGFRSLGGRVLVGLLILIAHTWSFGALWFDAPVAPESHAPAFAYLAAVLLLVFLSVKWWRCAAFVSVVLSALVAFWWSFLEPSNNRNWQSDVSHTPWAEVDGDLVTLHNVRNFDYRADDKAGEKHQRWETRTVRLSQLTVIDAFLNFWGVSWMAHPILSFQFTDSPPIAISIETRKEKGENYSALGGLYRRFELVYVVADERDVIRVRSNYRQGEEVYLYRISMSTAEVRERFLEYIRSMNDLRNHPRWYNAITANCTTAARSQRSIAARSPWDLRILLNGRIDEMYFQRGLLVAEGLPFEELKQHALINPAAKKADQDPAFSTIIRASRPGFGR
jgi:hypothetical protein